MGVLERFKDIMSSNVNALLDKFENDEKMLDQSMRKMREDLAEVRVDTQKVMANCELAKKQLDAKESEIAKCELRAMNALKAGDEEAAKELLQRKQDMEGSLSALRQNAMQAEKDARQMREMHDKLVRDIQATQERIDALKAQSRTADAKERMNKFNSGSKRRESGRELLDRMEDKVNRRLAEANAGEALASGSLDEDRFSKYDSDSSSVDEELAAMKAKLGL